MLQTGNKEGQTEMSKEIYYDLYVHITGTVEVDEYNGNPDELIEEIFPDGWEGEIHGVEGDIDMTDLDD